MILLYLRLLSAWTSDNYTHWVFTKSKILWNSLWTFQNFKHFCKSFRSLRCCV